jgi:hypothetical protein
MVLQITNQMRKPHLKIDTFKQGSPRATLVSHVKMCQISYKISLYCLATIVARTEGHTLETVAFKGEKDTHECRNHTLSVTK